MDSLPSNFHVILIHTFIAAQLLIAHNWKSPLPPDPAMITHLLNEQAYYEYTFAKAHLLQRRFKNTYIL